jgi:hypothetical protein
MPAIGFLFAGMARSYKRVTHVNCRSEKKPASRRVFCD